MTEEFAVGPDDIRWLDCRGPDEEHMGKIGIPAFLVQGFGHVVYADGYQANWSQAMMKVSKEWAASQLEAMGLTEQADKVRGRLDELVEVPTGAAIIVTVPDFPSPDGFAFVLPLSDAERFVDTLRRTIAEARDRVGKAQRDQMRAIEEVTRGIAHQRAHEATRCAELGCERDRHFFDDGGVGYCKQHAEDRGIRPAGKVV